MIASPSRRSQGVYDASDVIKHEADTTIEWRVATHDGDRFTVPSMHILACSWKQFRNDVMTRQCSNCHIYGKFGTTLHVTSVNTCWRDESVASASERCISKHRELIVEMIRI